MTLGSDCQTIAAMSPSAERRDERITIRITKQLREAIERAAKRERRKISDWIVVRLEDAIKQGKK